MAKSYSLFTDSDIRALGIEIVYATLFQNETMPMVEISDWLQTTLSKNLKRPLASEKAKSEHLIAPILSDLQDQNPSFTYFSGYNFEVDKKLGLTGFCDFIMSKKSNAVYIEAPFFAVVEAKNADIDAGVPQCIAELHASKIFNERQKNELPLLYGTVTTGFDWRFILLKDNIAYVDTEIYSIKNLPELFRVLQFIVN